MQDSELLNVYTAKEAIVGSSIVSFDDGADDAPIKSLLANIKPVQDLHGYSKPWVGGAGANLCRVARTYTSTSQGITYSENEFGTVHCVGTATAESVSAGAPTASGVDSRCLNPLSAGTYTISNMGTIRVYVNFRNAANTDNLLSARTVQAGANYTFTVSDPVIVYIRADIITGETVDADVLCMVTAGSTAATVFEPYQNICPITGSTSLSVYRTGKNKLPKVPVGTYSTNGLTIVKSADGSITVTGTASATTYVYAGRIDTNALAVGNILSGCPNGGSTSTYYMQLDVDGTITAADTGSGGSVSNVGTSNTAYIYIRNGYAITTPLVFKPMVRDSSASATYEPYTGNTYSVNWYTQAGTVYGGTLDLISGELTVTMANIASYNGETIGEPWLSSLDEYTQGGTPTTGAQVVYTLATPITYQLTPVQIRTISGTNNVWTDVGEIASLEYFVEQNKSFIDRLFVDGIDLQEKGWFLKWRKLSAPKPKTDYVSVFARDGDIDLTETEGQVFYEDRAIAMDMVYIGNEWEKDYSELLGLVHGQRLHVQFANDPSWYWSARLVAEIYEKKPRSLTMNGLAFPYKFDIVKTSASATVSGATEGTATTVTLEATRMPVSPKVTVTGTVTLKWGSATKQLSAGTYYVDGLKVGKDGLSVKVWGTGTATFEYRRGAL